MTRGISLWSRGLPTCWSRPPKSVSTEKSPPGWPKFFDNFWYLYLQLNFSSRNAFLHQDFGPIKSWAKNFWKNIPWQQRLPQRNLAVCRLSESKQLPDELGKERLHCFHWKISLAKWIWNLPILPSTKFIEISNGPRHPFWAFMAVLVR